MSVDVFGLKIHGENLNQFLSFVDTYQKWIVNRATSTLNKVLIDFLIQFPMPNFYGQNDYDSRSDIKWRYRP